MQKGEKNGKTIIFPNIDFSSQEAITNGVCEASLYVATMDCFCSLFFEEESVMEHLNARLPSENLQRSRNIGLIPMRYLIFRFCVEL